jgi:hypothetical protein
LTDEERAELEELLSKGELRARKANPGHISCSWPTRRRGGPRKPSPRRCILARVP